MVVIRIRYHCRVKAAEWVNGARRSAGLSQRELAARSGVPQPTIARIEAGTQVPRVDTLEKLLNACGWELDMVLTRGQGEDRSLIRHWLSLTPAERAEGTAAYARALADMRAAARRAG
jgi:transcriptional regulator with XRE-family HTH domain